MTFRPDMSVEEYEDMVFNEAVEFEVHRFVKNNNRESITFNDFAAAARVAYPAARKGERVLIYAASPIGRKTLLPLSRFEHFCRLWLARVSKAGENNE